MDMEGNTPQQGPYQPDHRPARPRYSRSRSQGLNLNGNHGGLNTDYGAHRHTTGLEQISIEQVPHLPSQAQSNGYTSHIRSSSRVSWNGRVPVPMSRTPSPSPPQSPVRRSNRPRPVSAVTLPPDYFSGRPTALPDRWSYDRERMPSPPLASHGSRPGTPLSEHEALGAAFSRPSSTFIESRPPSRPQSILLSVTPDQGHSGPPSTPTLRVIPPPDLESGHDREGQQARQPLKQQPYHLLTSEEMEMLSHPPPPHPPMSATPSPSPSTSGLTPPKLTSEISRLGPPKHQKHVHDRGHDDEDAGKDRPGCLGLCEISTASLVCGKFGAWFMGMAIPVTFGLVTGCVAAVIGKR